MAIPTISSVSPNGGPAGGRIAVEIVGTNFQLPPAPPAGGPVGSLPDTVAVEIDGVRAERVDVVSATRLRILLPPFGRQGDAAIVDPIPAVAVRVLNIDPAGAQIGAETVTLASGFWYRRSELRAPDATESEQQYRRVIREVVQMLQRQLVANTAIGTNVDFGDFGQITVREAKSPSCTLIGPRIVEDKTNRHHWTDYQEVDILDGDDPDIRHRKWPSFLATFEFDVVLASNSRMELFAMSQAFIEWFQRNPWVRVPDDLGDVNGPTNEFPLVLTVAPTHSVQDAGSNLSVATATFEVQLIPYRFDETVFIDEAVTDTGEAQIGPVDGDVSETFAFADTDP